MKEIITDVYTDTPGANTPKIPNMPPPPTTSSVVNGSAFMRRNNP